jgi:hypothetical protein
MESRQLKPAKRSVGNQNIVTGRGIDMITRKSHKGITRRRLMQGAAMADTAAAFAPRFSRADHGSTLRVRV